MNSFKAIFDLFMFAIWTVFGTFMALGVPANGKVITLMAITLAANALMGLVQHIFRK